MSLLLSELLPELRPGLSSEADVQVSVLVDDSRQVVPGAVYCAVPSVNDDGLHGMQYAAAAVAAGAVAVLFEPADAMAMPALAVPAIPVVNLGQRLGVLADRLHGQPSAGVSVTGVTGTDGKTSVVHLLTQAMGKEAAMLGTLGYGALRNLQPATHTTPPAIALQQQLSTLRTAGLKAVNMEVSSHALQQQRVAGVRFHTAVLTNLGRDHLDYHGTLAAYKAAKAQLFAWPGLQLVVVNTDDPFGLELLGALSPEVHVVGYGRQQPPTEHFVRFAVEPTVDGLDLEIVTHQGSVGCHAPLLGDFNASNLAAVFAVLLGHGWTMPAAVEALELLQPVPGRMARFGGGQMPLVVVDYAHTADALSAALSALRLHTKGRLICVFGCGGDRDQGKRPLMALAAEQLADWVIVTSDNPRTEDPQAIINDVLAGFVDGQPLVVNADRAAAIHEAVSLAQPDDVVLIAGKGHETYQIIGTDKQHFDDAEVVQQALEAQAICV